MRIPSAGQGMFSLLVSRTWSVSTGWWVEEEPGGTVGESQLSHPSSSSRSVVGSRLVFREG